MPVSNHMLIYLKNPQFSNMKLVPDALTFKLLVNSMRNQLTLKCTTLTPIVFNASPDVTTPTGNPYG